MVRELSLHLLDIVENSIAAGANQIEINVSVDQAADRLRMQICDNGKGMDEEMVARIGDPFCTTRTTRKVGLGIPLLKAAAEACNGWLKVESKAGEGTCLTVEFQNSHIDRMPLGDLPATLMSLIVANPDVRFLVNCRHDEQRFCFDTEPLRRELDGISWSEPEVLTYLRESICAGLAGANLVDADR